MHSPSRRILLQSSSSPPQNDLPMDSDVVVIFASLLCALISLLGLALVARCACLRLRISSSSSASHPPPSVMNKGIKKEVLESIPKLSFDTAGSSGECAICLAEFEDGDQIRVLPQCRHGFHAKCVDNWLGSHSSCPSCRQVLVVPALSTCEKCGARADAAAAVAVVVDLP